MIVAAIVALSMAQPAYPEEDKKEIVEQVLETALSPIKSVLGQVTELDRIVVTPSRTGETLRSASCSVSVIDKEDFERKEI